jgi:hypothetical protein
MPLLTAKCPSCGETIQIPSEKKETYCAYCGKKFQTKTAVAVIMPEKYVPDGEAGVQLTNVKKLRETELKAFLSGPGFTSLYQYWEFPVTYNAQIEHLDPDDILSKEMRICDESRRILLEVCSDDGIFAPSGIKLFGNKITVILDNELAVKLHLQRINRDAELILQVEPYYDFASTQKLMMDIIKLDKTDELYSLFSNGLSMALVALQNYLIPVFKKNIQTPLGDKLADCMTYIAQLITDRIGAEQLQYTQKTKILELKHLHLLK